MLMLFTSGFRLLFFLFLFRGAIHLPLVGLDPHALTLFPWLTGLIKVVFLHYSFAWLVTSENIHIVHLALIRLRELKELLIHR